MAEATRPDGAGSIDEVRRAFDAAADGAEKALGAILAEVAELGRRPMSLGEFGEELGVSATRVQQLMKPLREGGRVVSRPDPDSARRRRLWSLA